MVERVFGEESDAVDELFADAHWNFVDKEHV